MPCFSSARRRAGFGFAEARAYYERLNTYFPHYYYVASRAPGLRNQK